MRGLIAESGVEETCLEYLADAGWQVLYGPDIAPGEPAAERSSYREVLLEERLRRAVGLLNPQLPADAAELVVARVRRAESTDLLSENLRVHRLLTGGVPVEYRDQSGGLRHDTARLVDFDDVAVNDFVAVNSSVSNRTSTSGVPTS